VLSFVRSNTSREVGFLSDHRRINVAVTRAKRHVAIIADSDTVCADAFLRRLIAFAVERGVVRSASEYSDGVVSRPAFSLHAFAVRAAWHHLAYSPLAAYLQSFATRACLCGCCDVTCAGPHREQRRRGGGRRRRRQSLRRGHRAVHRELLQRRATARGQGRSRAHEGRARAQERASGALQTAVGRVRPSRHRLRRRVETSSGQAFARGRRCVCVRACGTTSSTRVACVSDVAVCMTALFSLSCCVPRVDSGAAGHAAVCGGAASVVGGSESPRCCRCWRRWWRWCWRWHRCHRRPRHNVV
jgi:hypothetical protein